VECGLPPTISHGETDPPEDASTKQFFQGEVSYVCDTGYTLDGKPGQNTKQTTKCQADKSFSTTKDCKPVQCEDAAKVDKATPKPAKTTFNKTIEYRCDEGYSTDGTNEGDKHFSVTCLDTGKNTDTGVCSAISCGDPDEVANAFREDGQVYFPEKRTYKCFEGFTLDGDVKSKAEFDIECQSNGKLTKPKQCLAVICGQPPNHIHALFATTADEGKCPTRQSLR
jgi:hypothetical protein